MKTVLILLCVIFLSACDKPYDLVCTGKVISVDKVISPIGENTVIRSISDSTKYYFVINSRFIENDTVYVYIHRQKDRSWSFLTRKYSGKTVYLSFIHTD